MVPRLKFVSVIRSPSPHSPSPFCFMDIIRHGRGEINHGGIRQHFTKSNAWPPPYAPTFSASVSIAPHSYFGKHILHLTSIPLFPTLCSAITTGKNKPPPFHPPLAQYSWILIMKIIQRICPIKKYEERTDNSPSKPTPSARSVPKKNPRLFIRGFEFFIKLKTKRY